MKPEWHRAFMKNAFDYAQCSEAVILKVGCAIVKNDSVISCGVNGTPRGYKTNVCEVHVNGVLDTSPFVIHAEANALDKLCMATESSVGASMFITHMPCLPCAMRIRNTMIKEVFYALPFKKLEGVEYLLDHGVPVTQLSI